MIAMNTLTPPPTHAELIAKSTSFSPHAAKLSMLNAMFSKADILNHPEEQIQVLLDIDGDGQLDEDDNGVNFTFISYDVCRRKQRRNQNDENAASTNFFVLSNCMYANQFLFTILILMTNKFFHL